ncbi:MAG: hypothetical protein HYX68_10785 [Planctomycetes bacterium]|nr:hypothetical protein [Planctomycetota bacterium]
MDLEHFFADGVNRNSLGAVGASLIGILVGLITVAIPRVLRSAWGVRLASAAFFLPVAGLVIIQLDAVRSNGIMGLCIRFGIALAGLIAIGLCLPRGAFTGEPVGRPSQWRLRFGLLAAGAGLYLSCCFGPDGAGSMPNHQNMPDGIFLATDHQAAARTDAGTPIPLYQSKTSIEEVQEKNRAIQNRLARQVAKFLRREKLENLAIALAGPDPKSNCHGWVFTGGRFCVLGDAVEKILNENGYEKTKTPAAEDLIIYRDEDSPQIVHSGVVRAVGEAGFVLIESRWGVYGHYLHRPNDQPYGLNYSYYRSERNGHHLKGLRSVPQTASRLHAE